MTTIEGNPYLQNLLWPVHRSGGLDGPMMPEHVQHEEFNPTPPAGVANKGWLCMQQDLEPGATTGFRFGLAWHFPNHIDQKGRFIGHEYANRFADAAAVVTALVDGRQELLVGSRLLPELLERSELPASLRLALLDQLNTTITNSHWSADGRFGIQEGHGCCAFNTMDIDHYTAWGQSFLQPRLRAQIMRQQMELVNPRTGHIHHGLPGSLAPVTPDPDDARTWHRWDLNAQFAIQLYRDSVWSGDRQLLEEGYPHAVRAIRLLAAQDVYGIGLPWIDGGFTYDHWKLRGVVGYVCGVYLAGLAACLEMAELLDRQDDVRWLRQQLQRGREAFETHLHNGQQYLLFMRREAAEEEPQAAADCGPDCACHREPAPLPIQDTGVMTDLLNGDGTARALGMPGPLDRQRVRDYLHLVLERNVETENLALINGSYPDGHFLDGFPFMQWMTPWTGSEYHFALQCYGVGMVAEGDRIIEMVQQRHEREGMRFDHAECNNHYARPLCIWGAYAARIGLRIDQLRDHLGLQPADGGGYRGVLVTATGLGGAAQQRPGADLAQRQLSPGQPRHSRPPGRLPSAAG